MDIGKRFFKILFLILALWVMGVVGYIALEGWGLVDAIFMTAISLTTTGYGEIHPLTPAGKIFTIFLLLFGVGLFVYAIGTLSEAVVEGHIEGYFKKRKMTKTIAALRNHFIVCGYGRIGRVIVETITSGGVPVVVIEKDPVIVKELEKTGILYVEGDATQEDILREAGIERSRGIVCVLHSDADNVYATLTARSLNPGGLIVARASDEKSERRIMQAGADQVISPYQIGARRMALAILKPTVTAFLDLAVQSTALDLAIEQIDISPGSPLSGKSIKDADLRQKTGVTILAVQPPARQMIASPSPDYVIGEGDVIIALGNAEGLAALRNLSSG
ncbi:MAG: NAD-binding protein [Deltaproteobacteria bacterium]